jgi:hypothetical protein
MTIKLQPAANYLGRDVSAFIPPASDVPGILNLDSTLAEIWGQAAPHLRVRNNDEHSLYAFALAASIVPFHPDADPAVVLPAILLHDTGWSCVPPEDVLLAIAPGGGRPDLVELHEKEGARIAADILASVGYPQDLTAQILDIIDGHDSRAAALSINDAIVKDADKLWRITPRGIDTIMDWFGLDRSQTLRLAGSRVHGHLFTEEARASARVLTGLESMAATPQMYDLDRDKG